MLRARNSLEISGKGVEDLLGGLVLQEWFWVGHSLLDPVADAAAAARHSVYDACPQLADRAQGALARSVCRALAGGMDTVHGRLGRDSERWHARRGFPPLGTTLIEVSSSPIRAGLPKRTNARTPMRSQPAPWPQARRGTTPEARVAIGLLAGLGRESRMNRMAVVDGNGRCCLRDCWASVGGPRMVGVFGITANRLAAVSRSGRYLPAGGDGGGNADYFWV